MTSGVRIKHEDAVKIMLKANLKPFGKYKNVHAQWKCKCLNCKKILITSYLSVAYHGSGCKYCNVIKKEINNKRRDSLVIAKKVGLEPLEPYKSIHAQWKCKCLICGKIVTPALHQLIKGQGCKFCAIRGINLNVPSYIYLITHSVFNSHKIGMGNKKSNYTDRLTKFKKRGWTTYKVWHFKTGGQAWKIEQQVFKVIRKDLKIPSHLSLEQMGKRLGGQTETMDADLISLLELEKIIKEVIRGYRSNP